MSVESDRDNGWTDAGPPSRLPGIGAQATRIRNGTLVLLAVICAAGVALVYAWAEATSKRIGTDLQDRLGRAVSEVALHTDHLLGGYERFLAALAETDEAGFEVLAGAGEAAFIGEPGFAHQVQLLSDDGRPLTPAGGRGMPLVGDAGALLAEVERLGRPLLSAAYRQGDAWYATIVGRGPVGARQAQRYIALTFPLAGLTEWWHDYGLPPDSSLTILTADRRLWWSSPLEPDALGSDRSLDPVLNTVAARKSESDVVEVVPPASGRPFMAAGRALEAFELCIVAAVPRAHVAQIWRDRHLGSLLILLAAGIVIVGAIGFAGRTIASDAVKRSEAMAALEASELRFRDMADAASDWFWRTDAEGRILTLSGQIEEVAGVSQDCFIGKKRADIIDDKIDPESLKRFQASLDAREAFRDFVYPYTDPNGGEHWFKISGKPIFDWEGVFRGYRGVGTDITEQRSSDVRLGALRARLERAIEHSPNPFALFDQEGRLAVMNQGFVDHFQSSDEQALGFGAHYDDVMRDYARSGRNLAAVHDPEGWLDLRRSTHETGRAVDEPLSDGRWIRTRESRTPEGELVCVYMDLTKEKRREAELLRLGEENRRLAAAVEATDLGIVITNPSLPDNQVIFVNPAFTRITGYRPDDVVGRNCRFLQGPDTDRRAKASMSEALSKGESVELEILNYRKDGQPFWNLIAINPVFDDAGQVRYFVGILNDVTAQKQSERELLLTKEAAEAANRSKSEFLAIMSHELRTPLNAIIGFSDILKAEMFGPVGDDRYKDYANDIFESGSHLLSLINDILDLSKAEAGKLDLRESSFRLEEAVERALGMMRPHANRAGIALELERGPAVEGLELLGDERKIKQVLLNLLSNAIKFSASGSQVTVGIARSKEGVVVEVGDEGIGIPAEEIGRALEPFHQVDSTLSREREGTGLGLPLAKRMIELHDGWMSIESTPDVGTRVRFTLPAARIQREAA